MRFSYGGALHADGEVAIAIRTEPFRDAGERIYGYRQVWQIQGEIYASSQNNLIVSLAVLDAVYGSDGGDCILWGNDTVTVAASMLNANCVGGTRRIGLPSYPENGWRTAEFSTWRTFEIAIEGIVHYPFGVTLLDWTEAVSPTGTGGPEFALSQPITGPPFKAQVCQATPCSLVQSGSAVGLNSYPFPPPPMYPLHEHPSQRSINKTSPQRLGPPGFPYYHHYEISWSYYFESIGPFPVINPNFWPGAQ